jgi:transposase-like protein
VPDPEVSERPVRRQYSPTYKLRILREADRCKKPGELGALLRREGLYSSILTNGRRQRERGELDGLVGRKRGRRATERAALVKENKQLRRQKARLEEKLRQAELIIEVQKKVAEALRSPLDSPDESDESNRWTRSKS